MDAKIKTDLDICFQKSNLKWLEEKTIYLTKYGSNAYGTNTPSSDLDVRGVCVPPVREYSLGILDLFEQAIFSEPIDLTIFGLQKFVHLSLEANPNCLEILFTDPSDHLFVSSVGESLLSIRELFLSKKCRYTNAGYAHQQLKRIRGHRSYLLHPPKKKPERKDFDLPDNESLIPSHELLEIEAAIRKVLDEWTIDTTGMDKDAAIKFKNELHQVFLELKINSEELDLYAARYLGLNDNLVEEFKKERAYKSAKRDWKHYQDWKTNRNPERAALENEFGFDLKHGMHLVRLYRMCSDLLRDGVYRVKRPDAEELLAIRNGAWTYDELIQYAEDQDKILNDLYETSSLRKEPERKKVNEWLIKTLEAEL